MGEGTTSRVYLSVRKDQQVVAIKIFRSEFLTSRPEARKIFIDELTALATLDHPNVVKMYEYGIDGKITGDYINMEGIWFIVLEYVSTRTLVDLVKEHDSLKEEVAKNFLQQMIETLLYINSKGIGHRDIKLENILVNDDYMLKFTDFGFASFSKENQTEQKGTPIYIAPEIIMGESYDPEKTDVFSTGVVLFALCSGRYPFEWAHISDKRYKLFIERKFETYWKQFERHFEFSETLKDLIQQMLAFDPNDRITLIDIANHDWFLESPAPSLKEIKTLFEQNNVSHVSSSESGRRGGA